MKRLHLTAPLVSLALPFFLTARPPGATAQIPLMGEGRYHQDFNTLTRSSAPTPWVDNETVVGWYARQSVPPDLSDRYGTIVHSDGSGKMGRIYSFGAADTDNLSLGGLASGSIGALAIGVQFQNSSDAPLILASLSFKARQWRDGGGSRQLFSFSYRISPEPIENILGEEAEWVRHPSLDFLSPSNGGTPAPLSDEPANGETLSETVNLVLMPGECIVFRWSFPQGDQELTDAYGIDDFELTYHPHH
ncbi:MAG TPA: hypothetical protein VNQ90_01060 [Chthoniobacteraceae bacterium]|nr:hypothetical protein [Chthoniobacteraceae bacterium]